ncbi:MAG TPA: gamma-glutamyltransferase [Planctomycetaceae bacterium]|nr:gamma-glutamyltransferase [Planctomycetaceae bacterium]
MHRPPCFLATISLVWSLLGPPGLATAEEGPATLGRSAERIYQHAVVAADHPLASEAGREILDRGGNVVDAAVATSFALSVVRPASCGIGGGGFMVIWDAKKQQAVALDYRERAPAGATRDMFVDPDNPKRPQGDLSRKGQLAVAVPGTVAGLCYASRTYGRLPLRAVLAPAIRLAREGVPVDDHDRQVQKDVLAAFAEHEQYRQRFAPLYQKYLNGGTPWQAGDRFHSPQADVLEAIAERGPDAFYGGPVAEAIVAEMQRGGGLITAADLAGMRPVARQPLQADFDGRHIVTMPPPSSGGVALIETLNLLAASAQAQPDAAVRRADHQSPERLHLLAESFKHAFADRAAFLGDTDFARVPVERLTSADYARRLAARIDRERTQPPAAYGSHALGDDGGTSHFSIIDRDGNAVACTETINTAFGSFVVEPRFGIVLNNEMDDFSAVPGQPNAFGLVQSEANAVEPGKKPLSSMTPTIVVEDGRAVHALGGSGGPRIISSTLQVLLNLTRHGMQPEQAVRLPRIHHQWFPDVLSVEDPLYGEVRGPLERRGHKVERRNRLAVVQAVSRSPDGLRGASDPRKGGRPAGY